MPTMFIAVLAVVGGFFLCLVAREWLRGREASQMAKIARKEVNAKRKKR